MEIWALTHWATRKCYWKFHVRCQYPARSVFAHAYKLLTFCTGMAAHTQTCNVNYVGPRAVVTVSNGSGSGISQARSQGYTSKGSTVIVTPLGLSRSTASGIASTRSTPITTHKLLIKVVENGEKQIKDPGKIVILRNINPTSVSSVEDLKSLIKAQLAEDVVERFDIGHIRSNKIISCGVKRMSQS